MENKKPGLEEKLRKIIQTIDAANALTDPLTDSIENLLRLSAGTLKSEDASVIIRDGDGGDMKFLAAIGKVADQITGLKIPAGKGIAGFVLSSGQPVVIGDAGRDKSFYAEVDRQTGYSTQTILATPLRYNDEILGVLEYINRTGEPPFEDFTPDEMDKAALFADAIASLVNAYETAKLFRQLYDKLIQNEDLGDLSEVREWLTNIRSTAEHREMIDLALLVREIAAGGKTERMLCKEILEAVYKHSKNNSETGYLSF